MKLFNKSIFIKNIFSKQYFSFQIKQKGETIMKLFNKSFIVIFLILFTVCVSNLFGQDIYDSPDGSYAPGYDKIVKQNSEGSIAEEEITVDNTPNVNGESRNYTDEYGSNHVNRVLYLGTGSTTRRVSVPHNSIFNGQTGDGSVEFWVYPTDLSHTNIFISKGGTTASQTTFYVGWSNANKLFLRIGSTFYYATSYTLPLNTWTHIGVTWTGGPNFTVRFIRNGAYIQTVGPTAATMNTTNTQPLIIGGSVAFTSAYTEGYMDEVRIWGPQRTTTEIRYSRFVGLGDFGGANTSQALTSSTHYNGCIASWTFNYASASAYDDIGGHTGTYQGGATYTTRLAGQPIPYNLALKCDGSGTNSYVKIPHNSTVFDQTGAGSFEAWIYLNSVGVFQPIFQKGNSFVNTTLAAYVTANDKFGINIGNHNFISSGTTFTSGKWYHVAATWTGGFTVRLYVNGNLEYTETFSTSMPTNTDDAWIGRYYSSQRFNGYIDEVRIWNPRLTDEQIRENMLVSGRELLPNTQLVGCWNFSGHLGNWSAITGVDGSFNTGSGNDCRLSGYSNETLSGAYSFGFDAHTTVLYDSYLNNAYFKGKTGITIPNPGYVQDTITVTKWPNPVTDVKLLVSIQHQSCEDVEIVLYAPNMQSKNISTDNGGLSDNGYLTIFSDAHAWPVTSSTFLSPWSNYVKPEFTMGNFGGSNVEGSWILRVRDDASGSNSGTLMGWGLRFNNSSVNVSLVTTNIPGEYRLHQNYPNPFNPITNINFDIPKEGIVSIKVYDITGREISTLVNKSIEAGSYNVEFDASDFASGTYFYKVQAGDFTDVKKMMLVK